MRFNSLAWLRGVGGTPAAPGLARLRRWLRRVDPLLIAAAGVAEPLALAVLVVTGLALPRLSGDWAPLPACRALHLLAGLTLALVLAWRAGAALIGGLLRLARRPRPQPASGDAPAGWRRVRDAALETVYHAALAAQVVTGLAHAWARRGGELPPGLPGPAQVQALHALGAPYLYAALLLLSYIEGRRRARALLQELRSP